MKRIRILAAILSLFLLFSIPTYADDNATDGNGTPTGTGATGQGYYYGRESMYKVSIYVGKSDDAYYTDSNINRFQLLGEPLFLKPSYLAIPAGAIFSKGNKIQHMSGTPMQITRSIQWKAIPNLPPPPVVCGGTFKQSKHISGIRLHSPIESRKLQPCKEVLRNDSLRE